MKTIGSIGEKGSFTDATPIDKEGFVSLPSLSEPEDREIAFFYYPGNAEQEELRVAAAATETRKVKVEIPKIKRSATFEMALNNWGIPDVEFNTAQTMLIYARKNTAIPTVWEDIK